MNRRSTAMCIGVTFLLAGCTAVQSSAAPSITSAPPSSSPATSASTPPPSGMPFDSGSPPASAIEPRTYGLTDLEIVDLEGSALLAVQLSPDGEEQPILYDLSDGSRIDLAAGVEARVWDLGERGVLMSVPNPDGSAYVPMLYDRASHELATLDVPGTAIDGSLIAGVRNYDRIFAYDLDNSRMVMTSNALRHRDRVFVAALSGNLMAGTFGEFDAEEAWLFDLQADRLVDVHDALGAPRNSWGNDLDGPLFVGTVEIVLSTAPLTLSHRAFVYDAAIDQVSDLGEWLVGSSEARAVDGDIVVGEVAVGVSQPDSVNHPPTIRAFAFDVRTGATIMLPGLPGDTKVEALQVSGSTVVGRSGSSLVSWTLPAD